jgi:hypothetical protein
VLGGGLYKYLLHGDDGVGEEAGDVLLEERGRLLS